MSEAVDKLFAGGAINSPIGRIIGMAEGNRTADGGLTESYKGHNDPNKGWNVGNYSVNSGYYSVNSPQEADSMYHGILQREANRVGPIMQAAGLDPGNALLMASYLDIWNQSPEMAEEGFLATLPYLAKNGITPDTLLQARIYAGDAGVGPGFNPTGVAHSNLWTNMAGHAADQKRRMEEIVVAMAAVGIPTNGNLTGLAPVAVAGDKGFTPMSNTSSVGNAPATLGTNGGSIIIGTYTKDCSKTPPWDWTMQGGKIYRGCALRITTLGIEGGRSSTPMVGAMTTTTTNKAKLTNASLTSTVAPPKAGTLLFPIQKAADGGSIVVTDSHGYSEYRGRVHAGIDIGSGGGSQVLAAADGVVLEAGPKGTYGNLIIIQHPNGQVTGVDSTRYAHLDSINVRAGDTVKAGQPIGIEGNTGGGLSTGVHLHFEVRDVNGQSQNPINYFDPSTTKMAEDPKGILQGGR